MLQDMLASFSVNLVPELALGQQAHIRPLLTVEQAID